MIKNKIINYLYDKVDNQALSYAFVASAMSIIDNRSSNHIKFDVYSKVFDMEVRKKYTGFEKLDALDKIARDRINKELVSRDSVQDTNFNENKSLYDAFVKSKKLENASYEDRVSIYRQELLKKAKKFAGQPNIIYLSGGADSELVARSFVEAGVGFVPVIFDYVDDTGKILNDFDTEWADKFCDRFDLNPVRRSFNVERFWKSDELIDIANSMQEYSPQLCVYHKMVELVHAEVETNGFDKFSDTKFKMINPITLDFADKPILTEVAKDIWTAPFFKEKMCNQIIEVLQDNPQYNFCKQDGDVFPTPELMIEDFDEVLKNAVEYYYAKTIALQLRDEYHIIATPLFLQYINRISAKNEKVDGYAKNTLDLHHDYSKFSMSIILNNNYEGGDLYFPRQNFSTADIPVGNIVIWPGQVTHPHVVNQVTKGIRYNYVMQVPTTRSQSRKDILESFFE